MMDKLLKVTVITWAAFLILLAGMLLTTQAAEPEPAPEKASQPEEPAEPDPEKAAQPEGPAQAEHEPPREMTAAQLRAEIEARGGFAPKKATKAQLAELLEQL